MLNRNATIDSIRGVAIILVLIHHVDVYTLNNSSNSIIRAFDMLLKPFVTGGWVAVDLFFVLSGFLVSGLLFKEYQQRGTINFGRFLIRRSLKIYPGFFIFIIISMLVAIISYKVFDGERPYFRGYVYDAFFLHNYLGGVWVTTWSLDVEEAFYILLPTLFIIAINFNLIKRRLILITYITLAGIGIIGRVLANIDYPQYSFDKHFSQTHYRLDALFFGVVLSYFFHYNKTLFSSKVRQYRNLMVGASILIILPNFLFTRENHAWISVVMLTLNPIAFGALLTLSIEFKPSFLEKGKWLPFVGVNSYAIYLWHPFVNNILIDSITPIKSPLRLLTYLLGYFALSVLVGTLATRIIERPLLHFRDKHFSKRSPA